jgi:flagellar biosynthetic protein FliR
VDAETLHALPSLALERLDVGWTFVLLLMRHLTFLMITPGIGGGVTGIVVRYPAALVFSLAAFKMESVVPVPGDIGTMAICFLAEMLLGAVIGMIPILIVAGAQCAGQVASGTMGLNGAQLIDPTTQANLPDLARIYGDLAILLFLMVGGHHVALYQLSGLESAIRPGSFVLGAAGISTLVDQSAAIFQMGVMIAAPVIVALLLTNFVLAIISKAVPTVNIFIISFPLTIAVGLGLSILALPEAGHYISRQFAHLEDLLSAVVSS